VAFAEPAGPQTSASAEPSAIERLRDQPQTEARGDAETAIAAASAAGDWTSSGFDGLMLDPDDEPAQEEWR
jgi:hypothetical protein